MKQINLSNIICSLIIGVAFILGCLIVKGNHDQASKNEIQDISEVIETNNTIKPLMTIQETAEYLNLSEAYLRTIISTEEEILRVSGSYTGMMFPIIRIGNDIFVSTNGLNDWLKESSIQRKQY